MTPANRLYSTLKKKLCLISGPCVIENRDLCFRTAERLCDICRKLDVPFIFKASFDKANRTSASSFRGPGMESGLKTLREIRDAFDIPVTTDVHETYQVQPCGEVADIIQIPAFLCRQTDLLTAAGNTGKIVNIKKAQFLSAKDMKNAAEKVASTGNRAIILTERGNSFGYNNLVVDFRNVMDMSRDFPTVMDITHSVQRTGSLGATSGGDSGYAPYFGYAAAALGVRVFFVETHERPEDALSDGPNMLPLNHMEAFLKNLQHIHRASKSLTDIYD